jgi:predicted Zn-dependent protease
MLISRSRSFWRRPVNSRDYTARVRANFRVVSDHIFSLLRQGEDLTLNLRAEESLYLRFNGNRVRQNTDIEQAYISLRYQFESRTAEISITASGNFDIDRAKLLTALASCRAETRELPVDINQVPVVNNGETFEEFNGHLLSAEDVIDTVTSTAEGSDLAGLYCGGTVINANRNSKGQDHWFATEKFFMDYSLYNGPKAAKAVYAGSHWRNQEWQLNLSRTCQQLSLLANTVQNVKPGKYRTYLAPGAVSELISMLSWGAVSGASWKQGRSALKRLAEGEAKLSPLFTLRENFALGLTPRFNTLGEVAPETLTIIEKGDLKEFLISSRTAKEYGLKSNGATEHENLRAVDVSPGSLNEVDVLRELGTGLYLSNLHYLNWSDPVSARVTGMTRYACFWVQNGEIAGPIKDLRFDETLYDALGSKLVALTAETEIDPQVSTYGGHALGGKRVPGMLIDDYSFTL